MPAREAQSDIRLTILLAFQNCTQLMTFLPKQTGPVKMATICGQVTCRMNHTSMLLALGKYVAIFHAVSGELATDNPRKINAETERSGEIRGLW